MKRIKRLKIRHHDQEYLKSNHCFVAEKVYPVKLGLGFGQWKTELQKKLRIHDKLSYNGR
jgi:hypothetical protein